MNVTIVIKRALPTTLTELVALQTADACFVCYDEGDPAPPVTFSGQQIFPSRRLSAVASLADMDQLAADTPAEGDEYYRANNAHRYCLTSEETVAFIGFIQKDLEDFAQIRGYPLPVVFDIVDATQ